MMRHCSNLTRLPAELIRRGSSRKSTRTLRAEAGCSPLSRNTSLTSTPRSMSEPLLRSGSSPVRLRKSLGVKDLIAFGIACTVGAGIFVTAGLAGKQHSGAALPLSVLLAGIVCILDGLPYAEFSSKIPTAGSVYSYAYNAFGEFFAFLMGWVLLLEYGLSACATARGFGEYSLAFASSLGVPVPFWLFAYQPPSPWGYFLTFSILPVFCILICTAIVGVGVEESAFVMNIITAINILLICFFVFLGLFFIDLRNFRPFLPPDGFAGVIEGAAVVIFCFLGFDAVTSMSEETKNPIRAIPLGLFGTLGTVVVLYAATSFVLMGLVPAGAIDPQAPLAKAFEYHGCFWGGRLVCLGAATTTFCTTFTCVMGQPRIFYRMATDGLWFSPFKDLNRKTQLPTKGIWLTGVALAMLSGVINFNFLVRLISSGTLVSYSLVNAAVLVNRYAVPPRRSSASPEAAALLKSKLEKENSSAPQGDPKPITEEIEPRLDPDPEIRDVVTNGSRHWEDRMVEPPHRDVNRHRWQQAVYAAVFAFAASTVILGFSVNGCLKEWTTSSSVNPGSWLWMGASLVCVLSLFVLFGAMHYIHGRLATERRSCMMSNDSQSDNEEDTTTAALRSVHISHEASQNDTTQRKHFRCPGTPWIPLFGILLNSYLIASLGLETLRDLCAYLGLSALLYACYGAWNSALHSRRIY